MTKSLIGSQFESNLFGTVTVIDYTRQRVIIKFHNTGNTQTVSRSQLYTGAFKDTAENQRLIDERKAQKLAAKDAWRFKKTKYGFGYLGKGIYKSRTPAYQMWHDMIRRCYDERMWKKNPTYKGCSVCDRWENYQNFAEDIANLPGYELFSSTSERVALDKDTLILGNKIYSPSTCCFLLQSDNCAEANRRRNVF